MKRRPHPLSVVFLVIISSAAIVGPVTAQQSGVESCARGKAEWMTARGAGPWRSAASANFDAGYYTLDLDLDVASGRVTGIVRATGRVVGSPMSALLLDFSGTMTVTEVRSPPYMADDTLQYTHAGDVLTIPFPIVAGVGQSIGVEVHYTGTPDPEYFAFGERNGATYAWSFSEPYGARAWWPCKDHPSDKADSVHVRITLPDSMRAGSQGNLWYGGPVGGGRALFEWHSKFPIATYLVSVAAGEYVEYNEVYNRPGPLAAEFGSLALPLLHYVYDDGTSGLPTGWAKTADALEVLEAWFGPYPFAGEKYGHAEWSTSGAMEHQTMTSMGSSSRTVMVHELAHQWFGDLISPASWPHLWLNEGFATYAEILYWQDRDADQPGTADILIQSMMQNAARADGTLVLEDTLSVSGMFNPARVYAKGGAVLHMLRAVIGESAFRTMLRDYAGAPALTYDVATTADFRAAAEAAYGSSLGWFFDQWVTQGTGYPRYQVTAHLRREGDYKAFVTVEQTQNASQSSVEVFRMPVTIAVNTDGGQERFTVINDQRRQVFELDVAGRPSSVVFDPDLDLLRDVDLSASSSTVARTPVFESIAPNPMGRPGGALAVVLPDDAVASLRLFDVAGRFVRDVARVGGAGPHLLNFDADGLPSGVYFLRIDAPSGGDVRKLTVVR